MLRVIEVSVPKMSLRWPNQCACCGEAAETYTTAKWQVSRGHGGYDLTSHDVPACENCAIHRRRILKRDWAMLFFAIGGMVSVLLSLRFGALLGVVSFVLWIVVQAIITAKVNKRRAVRSTAMMKPNCTGRNFVLVFAMSESQILRFTNFKYAQDFAQLNGGTISRPQTVQDFDS